MPAAQKVGAVKVNAGRRSDGGQQTHTLIRALNKTYEVATPLFTAGVSPAILDFNGDQGYNSLQGWITCDGPGDIKVEFSRDGIIFGDIFTMFNGENADLKGLDIDTMRITHTGTDSAYRVFLV